MQALYSGRCHDLPRIVTGCARSLRSTLRSLWAPPLSKAASGIAPAVSYCVHLMRSMLLTLALTDLSIDSAIPLRHPQHTVLARAGSAHIVGHIFGVHGNSISATISHHFVKSLAH